MDAAKQKRSCLTKLNVCGSRWEHVDHLMLFPLSVKNRVLAGNSFTGNVKLYPDDIGMDQSQQVLVALFG